MSHILGFEVIWEKYGYEDDRFIPPLWVFEGFGCDHLQLPSKWCFLFAKTKK